MMSEKLAIPHGLPQLIATYGTPWPYVDRKPAWEMAILDTVALPHALPYAYGPTEVYRIRGHRLVVQRVADILMACLADGVPKDRLAYGGMYCWRPKRTRGELSTHTWGIALDLDPARNPQGRRWDGGERMVPPSVVRRFEDAGFVWGGRWGLPDCQHFQAVDGY